MKNVMAEAMSERYAEYLHTHDLVERSAQNIYYWVMSTLESIFWGLGRKANFDVDLYATEGKILFVFRSLTGKEHEIEYYSTHACHDFIKMLQRFVEIFNNTKYPLTDKISSPTFHAGCPYKRLDDGKYKGYYPLYIHVKMLPDC